MTDPAEKTKIKIIKPSSGGIVNKGEEFVLECSGGGKPKPSFTWMKDGTDITSGLSEDKKQILTVKNVQRRNGGTYMCYGNNGIEPGKHASSNQANITVKGK